MDLDLYSGEGVRNNSLDDLETSADFLSLMQALSKYSDCKGNSNKFSLLFNTCNPDFDKIWTSNFVEFTA